MCRHRRSKVSMLTQWPTEEEMHPRTGGARAGGLLVTVKKWRAIFLVIFFCVRFGFFFLFLAAFAFLLFLLFLFFCFSALPAFSFFCFSCFSCFSASPLFRIFLLVCFSARLIDLEVKIVKNGMVASMEHFWQLTFAKFAPRLRARTIWKSKSFKNGVIGAFLGVEVAKICTTPACENDFEVIFVKTPGSRDVL